MIYPLRTSFKINEDENAEEQIINRTQSESNYEWSKQNSFTTDRERVNYLESLGRSFLQDKQ